MKTIVTDPSFEYLWRNISEVHNMKQADLKFETFPDGWPDLFIDDVKKTIEHRDVTYIWDFSNPETLFAHYSTIRWLLDYYADKVRIIMPYFPVWTMERIDTKWQIATAKYYADIFNSLPTWREWKTSIHILDIHALVERFFFDSDKISAEMHTAMSLVKDEIVWKTIGFPDEWAEKRFKGDFLNIDKIICSKVREGTKRKVVLKEWNPEWKNILLVDDSIQTWWTILETADLLRKKWAKSVSAFATHWVFPWDSHIELAKNLDKLLVTDSIPANNNRAENIDNMYVLPIQWMIQKIIYRDN